MMRQATNRAGRAVAAAARGTCTAAGRPLPLPLALGSRPSGVSVGVCVTGASVRGGVRRFSTRSGGGTIGHSSASVAGGSGVSTPATVGARTSSTPYVLASSISIADVLSRYQADGRSFTVPASAMLCDAAALMASARVGCLVAMEADGAHVAGLITERDILCEMVRLQEAPANAAGDHWTTTPVSDAMTRSREMVHCRPSDLIADALTLMTSQGFRHLPVLEEGANGAHHLRGMVSMRNLVDIIYKHQGGAKAQYLMDVLPRTGVPKNTTAIKRKIHSPFGQTDVDAELDADDAYPSLYLNAGACLIPHPDKKFGEDSFVCVVADVPRHKHQQGHATDVPVFSGAKHASASNQPTLTQPFSALAVFDGVGSWSFEKNVDPAKFSSALAEALARYVQNHPSLKPLTPGSDGSEAQQHAAPLVAPLSPACMLAASWEAVTAQKVVGSSTACILTLSRHSNELRAANIGDSGFLVLRRRDATRERLGSVGASLMHSSPGGSAPMYQVVYRSPQQLHYFNCPLQIGINADGATDQFESPVDADLLSVPVHAEDLVVLATDGLFDNVPEEAILEEIDRGMEEIEEQERAAAVEAASGVSASTHAALTAPPRPSTLTSGSATGPGVSIGPISPLSSIALALARLAHRLSLDRLTDSPFAMLAKENNILWKNGGRKDDITVLVARVDLVRPRTT